MIPTFLAAAAAQPQTQYVSAVDESLSFIWDQITQLTWLHAVIAISVGVVYMLYGWRIFRVLVVIAFGLIGMCAGIIGGRQMGQPIWGGVLGFILLAILAVPLMKWCVSVLGAVAGGIITGGLWYACGLPDMYLWAGAVIGVVAGGLISFILLKVSVMLFTSMGGSVIMITGLLALLYQYETRVVVPATNNIHDLVFYHQWFLPLALILPTVIGMLVQNKFIKHSQSWEI
ncbi:MAG: hypothetical protein LLF76_13395 [Planctomycetaceae bacterium]|nr:hypothetical protein [Planctomycetaceae bacterium]